MIDHPNSTILTGDVLDGLRSLPDGSVRCCVTSPPYWGLRDYGTAKWDGGDPGCDHVRPALGGAGKETIVGTTADGNGTRFQQYRNECGKCGARRIDHQIGLERTPEEYVAKLVEVFREVRRVLTDDGTIWLNLGDSYAGSGKGGNPDGGKQATNKGSQSVGRLYGTGKTAREAAVTNVSRRFTAQHEEIKPKDLVGIPWRVAFALQSDGWWLRQDIVWCLSGGARVYARTQKGEMPMSVKDLVRLDPSTVQLWNGEKWTQVLGWNRSTAPRNEALEIELASGERIGCTPGHVWPTGRGNLRADQIQPGDVIRTARLPEPEVKYAPSFIDGNVAWLLGLYLAEGSQDERGRLQFAGHSSQTEARLAILGPVAEALGGTARAHQNGENGACIVADCPALAAIVGQYVHGRNAKRKGIKVRAWRHDNEWLLRLLQGYLDGDGHCDKQNDRWRLGFTRNDRLASDLRALAARIGATITLKATTGTGFGRKWPIYRGEIRFSRTGHHNERDRAEVVSVRKSKARQHWDIGVADEPHLFALASGVLTHNSKPNPMPESVTDRCTKAHEYVFLLSKAARYYYDAGAVAEPVSQSAGAIARIKNFDISKQAKRGELQSLASSTLGTRSESGRNRRSVWNIATQPFPGAHFAVMPEALVEPCILAGSAVGDTVLDPFAGSGTVGVVALRHGRHFIGCELNPEYAKMAEGRISAYWKKANMKIDKNEEQSSLFSVNHGQEEVTP